jgi:hypothetical protein
MEQYHLFAKLIKTIKKMKNTPYVKEYNDLGEVKNPIPTGYFHSFPNRKQRREPLQKEKLLGKEPQFILDKKTNKIKRILHFKHN